MARHVIASVFFIASAYLLAVNTLQYSDIEELRVETCPSKNSCPRISSDSNERICECDSKCAFYNDCCIDANRGRPNRLTTQICMQFGNASYNGVYVIANCPSKFEGPTEVRNQCRDGDTRDPILNSPVTDTLLRRTYKNSYCALCNEATATNLTTWLISACKRNSYETSWDDIIYREEVNKWGRMQEGVFEPCDFMFNIHPSVEKSVRFCKPELVSSCPRSYTRATYRRACEAYMSVMANGTTLYRNPHCAVCNNVPIGHIKCFNPTNFGKHSKPFSFALLLDINRSDGDLVGRRNLCSSGEKYDPYFKKCRTLVCAIPGYTMVDDKCVKE